METRRTEEVNIFNAENIRNCERYVFSIQHRLDRAVATNNAKEVNVVNHETHVHHMLPCAFGGTERHSNLRLLPNDCHVDGHKRLSRKRMAEIVKEICLDYISAKESVISFDLESRVR